MTDRRLAASLDRLARLAARALDVPVAVVSLVDDDGRCRVGSVGLPAEHRARTPPCGHVVRAAEIVGIADLHRDGRFETSPLFAELGAVAYAGAPVRTRAGAVVGSFSVLDTQRRQWTADELAVLEDLAVSASSELDAHEGRRVLAVGDQRFRSLVEDLEVVIWEADANGESNRFVNRQAEELLGYPPEEWLKPRFWEQRLHPEDRDSTIAACRAATERAESHTLEYRLISVDGRVVWVRDRTRVVTGHDGRPTLLRGVIADITAEKEAELSLRETTQQYRALVEQAPVCTYRQNAAGNELVYLGPQIEALTGFLPEEWNDALFSERLHPEDRDPVLAEVHRGRTEGREFSMEYRFIARDGRTVWLLDTTVPIPDDDGRIAFRQGFVLDVTPAKEADAALRLREAQLYQTHKLEAIGNLAGGVAHDFNNVLAVVRGYCALLIDQLGDSEEAEQILQIDAAAERGADLVRQVLAYGRRQRLEPVRADLNELVTETLRFLERLIGSDIELRTSLDADLPPVFVDPARAEEAIVNLAANARDAMRGGGTLYIATHAVDLPRGNDKLGLKGGRYVALSVTDTGSGMDAAIAKQIFDPFFTTKLDGEGTGLGLAMLHGFVVQSGGAVAIETAVGRGTTFTLYLPVVEGAELSAPPSTPVAPADGSERILVVEDQEDVRTVLEAMLRLRGYDVVVAAQPGEALALLADGSFDLVVTDVVMPEMSGVELAKQMRDIREDLPVLFISGYAAPSAADSELGSRLLQKPFGATELAAAVREALAPAA